MRIRLLSALTIVALATSAGADVDNHYRVDPDVIPRMALEQVETLVSDLGGLGGRIDDSIRSIRCTGADRLIETRSERGQLDTRIVWVVEVRGEAGLDGAFYVLDDETGAVLAHGAVAAQ